ncbi:SMI1/KNR4 family protein [Hymenobacter guriensis]|uniref:SMI1/KNR4 family protein n=1 Tax=Hymenobacter guriensis TaxID=2793065 RepID=A0ABS0L7K7_9BACT|nr:SMI1/KNR4 family protein [Hymenobacter guriensis]MBG8556135.1 SMI1/KNR4 family protein [Hymenobacter guriensis]
MPDDTCIPAEEFTQQAATLKQLLAANADAVDFADFGEGYTGDEICAAEQALGICFPPSYRWWLKNYGGGTIGGMKSIACTKGP